MWPICFPVNDAALVHSLPVATAIPALSEGELSTEPFASVTRDGDVVVAALPTIGSRYLIGKTLESAEPRITEYGQSFRLHDRDSLSLQEHHCHFGIISHIFPPPAGLEVHVKCTGIVDSEKTYFIKAQ
jgi:hypothetical protein